MLIFHSKTCERHVFGYAIFQEFKDKVAEFRGRKVTTAAFKSAEMFSTQQNDLVSVQTSNVSPNSTEHEGRHSTRVKKKMQQD